MYKFDLSPEGLSLDLTEWKGVIQFKLSKTPIRVSFAVL